MTRRVCTLALEVKCPLQIETASQWEGCYWIECGCDLEVDVEYGMDVKGDWRIARYPDGCPLHPRKERWTTWERIELTKHIRDAWERYVDNQETPVYERLS